MYFSPERFSSLCSSRDERLGTQRTGLRKLKLGFEFSPPRGVGFKVSQRLQLLSSQLACPSVNTSS